MSYSIYRIPAKNKVGLAKDVVDRVEKQQGFSKGEYQILMKDIQDLEVARVVEKEYQKYFECEECGPDIVDTAIRKKKRMSNVFKTYKGDTIGFPVPHNELVEAFPNGFTLETLKGTYTVSNDDIKALAADGHFRKSKFDNPNLQTYIYTKIVDNYFLKTKKVKVSGMDDLLDKVHAWAKNRGILDGKIETQTLKLGEEFGELQKAVLKNRTEDIKDAIGDIIVVLVSIAHFNGHSVKDALQMAYDTISKRTGYTNDKGDFIKTHYNGKEIKNTL